MKTITQIWMLESNHERLYDEFAEPNAAQYAGPIKTRKKLLQTVESEKTSLDDPSPVAIVFKHFEESEDGEQSSSFSGDDGIYAVPLFGYQLLQQLEGRMLDYIDATYADKEQRESQKRIVRRTLWEFRNKAVEQRKQTFNNAESANDDNTAQRHEYEATAPETDMYVLPKEKLLSIIELENAWEHVGHVKSEYTDAYELLLPLGKDHTMKLIVDKEAVTDSGFFEKV